MHNKSLYFIIIFVLAFFLQSSKIEAIHFSEGKLGYIFLQVEEKGEAWYVYPENGERYYLGRPTEAFKIMKKLSLGAKHDFIADNNIFPKNLSGMILLDVELNGEAYYIYPEDLKKYYLGRPEDAFKIMRELGLGISNQDINYIPIGSLSEQDNTSVTGKHLIENVPFTSQAPFGNWSDQRQQDGCEEASSLMAVKWALGENLGKEEALEEIINASDYLEEKYNEYRDISAENTADWILKDYFKYNKVYFKKNITADDMIYELKKGNLLIVPMNGQLMHNPNFTYPGPPRHMVLVRGYDSEKKIFITNDPGTRNGNLYEYDFDVFFNAIRDYPTGYHELIEKIEKNMIIVWK